MKSHTDADRLRICQEQRARQATTITELQTEMHHWTALAQKYLAERDDAHAEIKRLRWVADDPEAHDPEAPPIPCVRVDDIDDRPTWRAMGEDVRTLGDEWERRLLDGPWLHDADAVRHCVYFIRRTQPPKPATERVPWSADLIGRVTATGTIRCVGVYSSGTLWVGDKNQDWLADADADGYVEVLTQDGDR